MSRRIASPIPRRETEADYFHNESSGSEDQTDYQRTSKDQTGEHRTSNPQPVAKSFHATISKDWTNKEALDQQRLVALEEKSELKTPLDSVQEPKSTRSRYGPSRHEREHIHVRPPGSQDKASMTSFEEGFLQV